MAITSVCSKIKPGTIIKKLISTVGIKPCGPCNKRAKRLDKAWAKIVDKK